MSTEAILKDIHKIIGTTFDKRLWDETRRGAFESRDRINEMRSNFDLLPWSALEYDVARVAYYEKYPDARGWHPYESLWGPYDGP